MDKRRIEGTTPFDGDAARKGYALNKMCFSFNSAENRAAFKQDEEAYMAKYGLTDAQVRPLPDGDFGEGKPCLGIAEPRGRVGAAQCRQGEC